MAVESGAGEGAGHPDAQYSEAEASVGPGDGAWGADVVTKVAVPTVEEIARLRSGQVLVGHLAPLTSGETNRALAEAGVTAFAMEAIPRITRAQAMDALSSQANVAGYAAALARGARGGPLLPDDDHRGGHRRAGEGDGARAPASPGLQAIATAKRLGAVVTGFDIRRAAWEQIASLGGRPLELDFIPDAEAEGGYARPLTDEENEKVREALAEAARRQDVIITTALIPGRPAPLLITADAVRGMQPGSVIVDLAGESGGNCELTQGGRDRGRGRRQDPRPAQPAERDGHERLPALRQERREPARPAGLREGQLNLDFDDEIVAGACITHEGEIKNERAREAAARVARA